ncbi:hypothetical protein Dda_5982 [Drechslerella dactyloides]|uniref:C3H1-type domain-containing protein n=1 Tax=Drechslerella dactyloides TaxID=74499 RepID=A0AAD6IUT4_DREDA|nr:hypothetical protein Dda_5982 [Drechslerella dactyloides]
MAAAHAVHGPSAAALLATYRTRFEELAQTEGKKDKLIEDLIQQNDKLAIMLERYEDDLEREKGFARMSQKEIRDLKLQNATADDKLMSYPYIQVLIDGDGMMFNLDLMRKKKDGGSEAAELLIQDIRETVRARREELCIKGDFDIRVLVFANLDGLSRTLVKANLLSPGDLQQFFVGFTQRLEHVNFIDVGYGKEMADSKIRGEFLFHLKDPRCRLIFFGGSHDNGYAPFLKTCTATSPDYPIWLLEGPPTAREITALNLPGYRYDRVFSKESQNELTSSGSPISPPAVLTPTSQGTLNMQAGSSTSGSGDYRFSYASAAVAPSPITVARPTSIKYNTSPTMEPSKTITVSGSGTTTNSNDGPRGIQHSMVPSADAERVNYIKNLNPRACNNFYLRGSCYNQPCSYSHKYKLRAEDVRTLRYIIERSKPCQQYKKKGFCDDEKCYYGHQCPFRSKFEAAADKPCSNSHCRFCQTEEQLHGY